MNKKEKKKMWSEVLLTIGSILYLIVGVGSMVFAGWLWLLFQMTGLEANIPLLVMPIVAGFGSVCIYYEMVLAMHKEQKVKK